VSRSEFGSITLTAGLVMWLSPVIASGQVPQGQGIAAGCPLQPAQFHKCAVEKAGAFNPPRTADGKPDMGGTWSRSVASQDIEEHTAAYGRNAGPSLIVDPPDGKIPYQPWALERRNRMIDEYISPLAACSPPGVPRQMYGPGATQILQIPGYVVLLLEYSHTYRVIPTTPSPHAPGKVKLWMGDSRGRWEGNTLVVDVTNSNGLAWMDNAGNFYSNSLRVVERFTLVDADTIHYEARLEDPVVYTRPWTMAFGITRNKDPRYELLEEACHEGNQHTLTGQQGIGLKRYPGVQPAR
jgi:hypothetical protein